MAPVDDTRERPPGVDGGRRRRVRRRAVFAGSLVVAVLPLAGLASLLLRSRLDPHIENYRLHFVVFGIVGGTAFLLGYAAGEAANRRGDARVLLLSLAFMATEASWGSTRSGRPGSCSWGSAAASRSRSRSGSWYPRCSRRRRRSSTSVPTSPRG